MLFGITHQQDFSVNSLRRKDLISAIKQEFPDKDGVIVLFAGFEGDCKQFKQESSFYYLTGIDEPGVVLVIDLHENATLYVPHFGDARSKWMASPIALTQDNAKNLGLNEVKNLGAACAGYQFHPFFSRSEYQDLLTFLSSVVDQGKTIFTLNPNNADQYIEQRLVLERLKEFMPDYAQHVIDIASLVAKQRRIKDMKEIETLYTAVEITSMAQEAAAKAIEAESLECEVQASLEYIFTAAQAAIAFPSIVGSGKNSTVLHYNINKSVMKNGDLVVIDIGAQYNHYCADITRTYPVSGTFTKRQREVYNIVLDTQEYIASIAKPGYWLNNVEHPEKSLNHLARVYLAKKGYDKYFTHGIGHYLGLDVHDVGDYKTPLQEGDVFTIEPGIYIPEESLGVRIEDDYWVVKDGVVCLSEQLLKKAEDIEAMMAHVDSADDQEDDYEFEDESDFDDEDASEA
ncbi:MAG: Xaa-Pro peptidase family protein [Candidatus Babeliales bacterium]|nr:Xaa-Pro peptidase family protein [Candidatus Babeliales bacterium]